MVSSNEDILVLRSDGPGLSAEELHSQLKNRMENRTVRLAQTPKEEMKFIQQASIVTGYGIREELLLKAKELELYAHVGIGTDNLPIDLFREKGISVTNASGLMPQVAEQVIGYLLFFSRRFNLAWKQKQNCEWRRFQPTSLVDSTVTIVGLGSIGHQLTDRLAGFNVETIGIRHTPSKGGPTDEVIGYTKTDLHEAFSRTDYLVLACPLTNETKNLIDSDMMTTLPRSSFLVNVSRGKVVDNDDLLTAIQNDTIAGAALDVTNPEPLPPTHPLWNYDNVFITPHTAGNDKDYWKKFADRLTQNIKKDGGERPYVNLEGQVI